MQHQETARSAGESPPVPAGIARSLVTLCAVTAGCSAANIYYAQPLLHEIAESFRVGNGSVSLIVTMGTIGYTVGMVLLVPLGDVVSRRRLAVGLLCVVAAFQAVSALAPSLAVLLPAALGAAVASIVSPLMVSFAATVAAPGERGRVTGAVMSGVLLGVLFARTAGALIAQFLGWRAVYALAAVVALALAFFLRRALPEVPALDSVGYARLLRSVPMLLREEPALRLRSMYGFVCLAAFNALWTCVGLLLASPPYSYSTGVIGLFGVTGVIGALGARITGRLADRGGERWVTGALLVVVAASWGLMALDGGRWLWALAAGAVALDFGIQGMQVTNLSVIYQVRPEARSRSTTAYLTVYFAGGIAGSAAAGAAYAAGGWYGVCVTGGAFAGVALLLWASLLVAGIARRRRGARGQP